MIRTSFASRYSRSLKVVAILKSLEDYNPTRVLENLENFQNFLNSLRNINNTVMQYEDATRILTNGCYVTFYKGQDSILRSFTALKFNIGYQYSFDSTELCLFSFNQTKFWLTTYNCVIFNFI